MTYWCEYFKFEFEIEYVFSKMNITNLCDGSHYPNHPHFASHNRITLKSYFGILRFYLITSGYLGSYVTTKPQSWCVERNAYISPSYQRSVLTRRRSLNACFILWKGWYCHIVLSAWVHSCIMYSSFIVIRVDFSDRVQLVARVS